MRLIDADLLLENAKNELNCEGKCCECDYYNLCEIYKMVDNQPTAYDVDKVVEQLERDSQNIELIYPTDQRYDYKDDIGIDINKAKEIIKSGGIKS